MAERTWYPISKLGFFVDRTAAWLVDVQDNADTLLEACANPYQLTADEIERTKRAYTDQAHHITLTEQQAARWATHPHRTDNQREDLHTMTTQLTQLRVLNRLVLQQVDELTDAELGLRALLDHRRRQP